MKATDVSDGRRELAHRVGAGLEVTLYWSPIDDRTSIEIRHVAANTTVRFGVPADRALNAFHHPLAHLVPETSTRFRP